jgi:hypothetical protein
LGLDIDRLFQLLGKVSIIDEYLKDQLTGQELKFVHKEKAAKKVRHCLNEKC